MIFLPKIFPQDVLKQRAKEDLHKSHLGLMIGMTFLFGIPTVCWVIQMTAALNQPNNFSGVQNYSEMSEMF